MTRTSLLLIAAVAACGSDVELQLDIEGPRAGVESRAVFGPLDWSYVDLGSGNSNVHDLAWAPDGALFASMSTWDALPPDPPTVYSLARFGADGQRSWVLEEQEFFANVGATPDGGVVVARAEDGAEPGPAGLDWYSRDGVLTASWRLEASETTDALREILQLEVTPDGGVVWAGVTRGAISGELTVAGHVDAQGQLLWMVSLEPAENAFESEYPLDLLLTPDGGSIALVGFSSSSYVVRLEADGTEAWRLPIRGGYGRGIELTPSGTLALAGVFADSMSVGDFGLSSDELNDLQAFMAEVDPQGQVLAAREIWPPEAVAEHETYVNEVTQAGDSLLVTGRHFDWDRSALPQGFWLAAYDASGQVIDEAIFPMDAGGPGFGPGLLEVDSSGRLAVGGALAGEMDLGGGEVSTGPGFPMRPFIAVYDQPSDVD
jgi:hypothetical protein